MFEILLPFDRYCGNFSVRYVSVVCVHIGKHTTFEDCFPRATLGGSFVSPPQLTAAPMLHCPVPDLGVRFREHY